MKKAGFLLLITFTVGCLLFSQSRLSESWLSFGAEFNNSFERFSREDRVYARMLPHQVLYLAATVF